MTIEDRKLLRMDILRELYELYFDANISSSKEVSKDLLKNDREKYLAYIYLEEKGFIKDIRNTLRFTITVSGMDLIEYLHINK